MTTFSVWAPKASERVDLVLRGEGRRIDNGVVMMSRRHVDGFAFADPTTMAPFFDVATVRDPHRP